MLDVLCAGFACLDLSLQLPHHPSPDEKLAATGLTYSGGGPAANAAVQVARLGGRAGFIGRLGNDSFGHDLLARFAFEGVVTSACVLTDQPTPLAVVLTKPDGTRNALGYRPTAPALENPAALLARLRPKVLLLDSHRPEWIEPLAAAARTAGIPIVADIGTPSPTAHRLAGVADHLVASEVYTAAHPTQAPDKIHVTTLGERGLAFTHPRFGTGQTPAFSVNAIDSNGAGDAFHGAYALGLAQNRPWPEILRRASAAGALTCTRHGSWTALPHLAELENFLNHRQP